jgi:hypothetical protein
MLVYGVAYNWAIPFAFPVAAVLLVAFVLVERRTAEPLMSIRSRTATLFRTLRSTLGVVVPPAAHPRLDSAGAGQRSSGSAGLGWRASQATSWTREEIPSLA